jgi:hypothetical protein
LAYKYHRAAAESCKVEVQLSRRNWFFRYGKRESIKFFGIASLKPGFDVSYSESRDSPAVRVESDNFRDVDNSYEVKLPHVDDSARNYLCCSNQNYGLCKKIFCLPCMTATFGLMRISLHKCVTLERGFGFIAGRNARRSHVVVNPCPVQLPWQRTTATRKFYGLFGALKAPLLIIVPWWRKTSFAVEGMLSTRHEDDA